MNSGGLPQHYGEVPRHSTDHPPNHVYPPSNGISSFAGPLPTMGYPPVNTIYAVSNHGYQT